MAVYTHVDDASLGRFLADYDLGPVTSFKGIAGGVENSNYFLQTSRGSYILTLYEKRVAAADLPFFIGLMDHLAERGFPCPEPVRDRRGNALSHLCDRPAAIVTFLPGIDVEEPTLEQCRQAGETMARLHERARGFGIERANALAPEGWPALADAARARADEVEQGLADLMDTALLDAQSHWPGSLPSGVIHADLFRDNVFFLDGKLSGVIDFYFACNDFLAYDIAVALNAWCFDGEFEFVVERANSLIAGYESVRGLEAAERDALPVLARGAALRFLLTRVNDWLNVPKGALVVPHDPTDFTKRLRFFRSVDDPSELGA